MVFGGQKYDEILHDGIPLLACRPIQRRTRDKMRGIFSIEVESQRARNHEPLSEAVHRYGVIVTAGGLNPFSGNPEVISPLEYAGGVKVREQS